MSEIRATTISDAAGTGPITLTAQSAAKHFNNFNGANTVSIRDSFNQSSITDQGVGNYDVSLSSSMGSAENYSVLIVKQDVSVNTHSYCFDGINGRSASVYEVIPIENAVRADSNNINGVIFGDLA